MICCYDRLFVLSFYRLWLHSSLAEGAVFMGMLMFSVLLSTNVLTVWGMLTRYGIVAYPSDIQYYIIEGGIIALLSWRFFFRKRYDRIIARYDDESPVQRKSGAWVLALYVAATFIVFSLKRCNGKGKYDRVGISATFGTPYHPISPIFATKTIK